MTNDNGQRPEFWRLASGVCFVLALGCPQKDSKKITMDPPPSQIIEDFRLQETDNGRVYYDLTAEKAYVYESANRIDVTRPNVRFYDTEGKMTSTLTADSGSVQSKTSDLVARSRVLVKTRDSTTLETDSLVWKNKDRIITTDAPVSMHSPNGNVSGVGLESDADLKRIEIKNTVQATTKLELQGSSDTTPPSPDSVPETK